MAKIEAIFEPKLKSIQTHIVAMSTDTPEGLIWNQIKSIFFMQSLNRYQFWYKPHISRVLSVDQSITGDVTAITVSHAERDINNNTIYIVDMVIVITPKGGRVNLDAIRYFITDLIEKGSMNITHISFDQFQSEATVQYLKRWGLSVEQLSVDRTMDAYLNLISIIESSRLRAGRNLHLKNNLKSLQISRRRGSDGTKKTGSLKVDHTLGELVLEGDTSWERSMIGIFSKDAADAVCANVELLRKHGILAFELWAPEAIVVKSREESIEAMKKLLFANGLA